MNDYLGYRGKVVVITGAATGMGGAATRILVDGGAEIYAVDIKPVTAPVKKFIKTNLADKASIDAALAEIPAKVDCVFSCAGIAGAPNFSDFDCMMVNFVGARHLLEALVPRLPAGGAIAIISSMAGLNWKGNLETVNALLGTKDFDEGKAWLEANPDQNGGYMLSKQCLTAYTHRRAFELAPKGVRVNCISPCPTETPLLPHFEAMAGGPDFMHDYCTPPVGRYATPEDQAGPLVFLNSDLARFVSGVDLVVDHGDTAGILAGLKEAMW